MCPARGNSPAHPRLAAVTVPLMGDPAEPKPPRHPRGLCSSHLPPVLGGSWLSQLLCTSSLTPPTPTRVRKAPGLATHQLCTLPRSRLTSADPSPAGTAQTEALRPRTAASLRLRWAAVRPQALGCGVSPNHHRFCPGTNSELDSPDQPLTTGTFLSKITHQSTNCSAAAHRSRQ